MRAGRRRPDASDARPGARRIRAPPLAAPAVPAQSAGAGGRSPPPRRPPTAATARRIGAAVQSGYLANEPDYVETLVREFNAVTAEFEALWVVLHPARGVYDFAALDAIADFAEAHDMLLRGHHLV